MKKLIFYSALIIGLFCGFVGVNAGADVTIKCTDINGVEINSVIKSEQLMLDIKAENISEIRNPVIYSAVYHNGKLSAIESVNCEFSSDSSFEASLTTPDKEFSEYKIFLMEKDSLKPLANNITLKHSGYSTVDISAVANGRIYLDNGMDKKWDAGKVGGLYSEYDFIAYSDTLSSRFALKKSSFDSLGKNGIIEKNGTPYVIPGIGEKETITIKPNNAVALPIGKKANKVKFLAVTERSNLTLDVIVRYRDGSETYSENMPLVSGYTGANSTAENFVCRPAAYVAWYNSTEFSDFGTFSIFEYDIDVDADKIIKEIEFSTPKYSCNILAVTLEAWNDEKIADYIQEKTKNADELVKDAHLVEQLCYLYNNLDEKAGISDPNEINVVSREVYVDADSSYSIMNGSREYPFKTIVQAQEYIRSLPRNGRADMRVLIKGEQPIESGITFTKADSGVLNHPVVYTSYEGRTTVTGMVKLYGSMAKAVTNEQILFRIPESARDKVVEFDLSALGLSNYGTSYDRYMFQVKNPSTEVICDGVPVTRSRWPNDGWANVDSYVATGTGHYGKPPVSGDNGITFTIKNKSQNFNKWTTADNAVLVGSWYADWAADYLLLDSVNVENGTLKTKTSPSNAAGGDLSSNCFYIENLLEELDNPLGEWYIDNSTNKLYMYPPQGFSGSSVIELAVLEENALNMDSVQNISFENIDFCGGKKRGINLSKTKNCTLAGLNVKHFYGAGVYMYDTYNCKLLSSDVCYTGEFGVAIKEDTAKRSELISGENCVENCKVSNTGRQFIMDSYATGIYLEATIGAKITNNEIFDTPYIGIIYTGNNNIIEYNNIHHTCKETGDTGAVYGGQKFTDQGNRINYNYIHDITQNPSRKNSTVTGIYFDDMESGNEAFGNIINRVPTGILVGGGKNVTVKNNIIMNSPTQVGTSDYSIFADSRGITWASGSVAEYASDAQKWWSYPKWQESYKWMASNYFDSMQGYPTGNNISNNLLYNHKKTNISKENSTYGTVSKNTDYTDWHKLFYGDIFINESAGDLRLKEKSGAFKAISGFQNIPFEKIGVYNDEYRNQN